jgi:diguanylate cyclase (GGDEF)-like protein
MFSIGTAMWLSTSLIMIGASFVPQIAPDDAEFWRIALGVPALLMTAVVALVGWKLPERLIQPALFLGVLISLGFNVVLLQITPATQLVLFNSMITLIYAGYFLRLFPLIAILLATTALSISTLYTTPASDTPYLASFLIIYIPTFWLTSLLLHLQNRETSSALARAWRRGSTDALTGLANLRALKRVARTTLTPRALRRNHAVPALLLIDLDNFKSANSRHGHVGGDHALRMIAAQLERVAPKDAVVARIGGDEFAVLLRTESPEHLEETGEIFRGAVRAAGSIMKMPGVQIDSAVGVAAYPRDGSDLDSLLDVADRNMYKAKGAKRHPVPNLERRRDEEPARPEWLDSSPSDDAVGAGTKVSLESITGGNRGWLGTRSLYTRASALAYVFGSIILTASLLAPDAVPDVPMQWWMALGGGLGMAVAVLLMNSDPPPKLHILHDVFAFVGIGLLVAVTGGLESSATPLLILVVASQAWFWETKHVIFRLVGPVLVTMAPLAYTSTTSSQADVLQIMTLYGLSALIVTLVLVMYFDRRMFSKLEQRAQRLASTDPLTGISNRRIFDTRVHELIGDEDCDRFAIVMIDLDNFKQVNTDHGHRTGDTVLREIAEALEAVARNEDCVARIGGDEFAAVLPDVGVDGARSIAERFVRAVADTPSAAASEVSASAGFALYPVHGTTLDELMFTADGALMAVKASGKGSARVARIVSAVR